MARPLVAAVALCVCAALPAIGRARPITQWSMVKTPAPGAAAAIGGYSNGCVRGAQALKRRGKNYRLVRPGRGRNFGHPQLLSFIKDFAAEMKRRKLGVLSVGDLSQPRGGPAPNGHASHQSGLDADLWYLPPTRRGQARSLVDHKRERVSRHFSRRVAELLELAASDPRTARIFVHPVIKRELCKTGEDRAWLRKLRPWWGHDAHFHVRLACPADDSECDPQPDLPAGNGCDEIEWWFSDEAKADREQSRQRYRDRIGSKPALPPACQTVLEPAPGKTDER